jgi:hypothetical protein
VGNKATGCLIARKKQLSSSQFPTPQTRQGAPQQASGGCGQAYNHGKVNNLEAEAIQDALDVAVGMFQLNLIQQKYYLILVPHILLFLHHG